MEWKEVRLGEICSAQNGYAFKSSEFLESGDMNVIKIKEVKDNGVLFSKDTSKVAFDEKLSRFLVKSNDVVFALTGDPISRPNPLSWVGRVAKYRHRQPAVLNQRVCRVDCTEAIDSDYLFYYFKQDNVLYSLASTAKGSASQANISTKDILDINIALPPLFLQRRIANILSSLDRKIELNNKINAQLEEMAQTLFKHWFVDFGPFKDGKFVESELGMIPEGWRVGTLGEISSITSGKRPPMKQKECDVLASIPLIGAADIMGYTNDSLYNRPILIIGRVGTHGIVQRWFEKCWPSDNTLVLESISYEFVYQILKNIDYSSINRGSTQPLITQTDVKNTCIVIPKNDVLDEFEDKVSAIMKQYLINQKENQKLASLRDTLLPKLMSGEINLEDYGGE